MKSKSQNYTKTITETAKIQQGKGRATAMQPKTDTYITSNSKPISSHKTIHGGDISMSSYNKEEL
jgi:hypothetical protein